jgi:hypothetical protein
MIAGAMALTEQVSNRIPHFEPSKRAEYVGPQLCQATRCVPAECSIPSDNPNRPYLSHAAADRLEHRALSPAEWFRLVALHGRGTYWLWEDFYGDDGTAYQPTMPVPRGPDSRIPSLRHVKNNLEDLLDFIFVHQDDQDDEAAYPKARKALARFKQADIIVALDRRVGDASRGLVRFD